MAKIKTSELVPGYFLSKAVINDDFQTLLYEGTKIVASDIEMLKSEGIEYVYVFSDNVNKISKKEKEIITKEIHKDCTQKVKKVLNTHICSNSGNLKELSETAENIVDDIFKIEDVASTIFDIKQKSADLYDHAVTVSTLSILTALKLNLSHEEVCDIGVGGLLHDLGLKYINVSYIDRDYEDFDADDLFEYKKHTLYGFSSVEEEKWMATCSKRIVLQHHERLDGSGYPFRQKTISVPVKIVAVCDGFHDRISGIGMKSMKVDEALLDIEKYIDVYFDGKIVDIFEGFIAMYPVGTKVLTNRNEEAEVIEQTEYFTDRPIIKLLKNAKGEPYNREKIINLSENNSVRIVKSL